MMDEFVRTGRHDWMWGATLVVVAAAIAIGAFLVISGGSEDGGITGAGGPCGGHGGEPVPVPEATGIRDNCIFWLHTHDSTGLLHIEAPEQRAFTLGQFFAIWG